ncbi:peptidyl-prolyl cis-trans isomerase [bacterium]|nr:peptidyl-prolyl cis-trans isomerase [bacterium]
MLYAMRKNLKKLSWVLWLVIATFVGTIFAVWGIGGGGRGGQADADIVAWIDEKPVSSAEFYETRQRLRNWYQQIYGERFDEFEERLQLSDATLSQIIQMEAQSRAAEEMGISVSLDQVKQTIAAMPEFQEEGRFSRNRFVRLLAYNHIAESDFIEQMKADLARKRIQQLLTDAIWLSDAELKSLYQLENEMVRLEYLQINARQFTNTIEPADTAIENYFNEHAEDFQIPDKVSVKLITIDPLTIKSDESVQDQLSVSEEEIEDYYYENDTKFATEKEVRARHILFKAENVDPEMDAAAKKKADDILAQLKEGADFIELAKKYSEDTSAARGGDVGFFPRRGRMVEPFANAAFSLEEGELSDVVKTQYGYHIIRVDEIKEAGLQELDDVKEDIKNTLVDQKAMLIAESKAERIRDRFAPPTDDTEALAKRFNLTVMTTELFAEREMIPDLGWMPELARAAFTLEPEELSPIIKEKEKLYLCVLNERVQSHQAQFTEVKDQARNKLIEQLGLQKAQKKMDDLLSSIEAGKSWDSLTEGETVKLGDTGLFSRKQSIKGVGRDEELIQEAFQKNIGDMIGPKEIRQMLYIFKIKEKQEPNWNTFEDEKVTFKQQHLTQYGSKFYNNWLEQRKSKMEVVKNQNFFDRFSS